MSPDRFVANRSVAGAERLQTSKVDAQLPVAQQESTRNVLSLSGILFLHSLVHGTSRCFCSLSSAVLAREDIARQQTDGQTRYPVRQSLVDSGLFDGRNPSRMPKGCMWTPWKVSCPEILQITQVKGSP